MDERSRALALYSFVRRNIEFGFTDRFDDATPDETLSLGRGHCNPQASLLVALFRDAGLDAEQHFVSIAGTIISDFFAAPSRITHSYVRVWIDGSPICIDGYICDPPFLRGAHARLERAGRAIGFGAHRDGCGLWDGRDDCMSQLADPMMVLQDHGPSEPETFFRGPSYDNRMGAIARFFYRRRVVDAANSLIAEVRDEGRA